ncbi:hypothetical protein PVK06_043680 [Gossypium arboreum]|uniref:Retrotransposon gag domain-containing protein n=1 Tax=Gossypium arboreum TaxID=29729 RepID=A0ABR0MR60_GOSAR|nr:hypothetical protein PVK06_043680 [Gossypium arboreum]
MLCSFQVFIITHNNMNGKLRRDQRVRNVRDQQRDTILDMINKNLDRLSTKIECWNRNWEDKVDQPRANNARHIFHVNNETLVNNDRIQHFLDKPKFNIPPFRGKYDPEAYCEWESKIELLFRYYKCSEEEKVQFATLGFSDYALSWWIQLGIDRQRNHKRVIETWDEVKQVMQKRYIPFHYYREVLTRLQRLVQGNRSVDEYFKEMEMLMQRANIQEDKETTIVRFIDGLNVLIANALNLHTYIDLEEMVQKEIEIKQQFQQHQSHPFGESHYYRGRGHYSRDCANTRLLLIKEDGELYELEKNDNENSFLESIELDEIKTSCSPTEIYCTELNIHNTCEGDMGREEKSCEKTKRKETFSDKSLLNGPNLVSENPYEDFNDPLTDSQLYYSTIDRQFYLWERGKLNIDNSPQERYLIHADLGYQNHIFDPGDSFGAQESLAKDSGTNLLEEVGNNAGLKAQFQTHGYDGFTLLQGSTTMSMAKQIKSGLDQRQDSRTNLFEERENDTCTDRVKFIRFQSSKLPIFRLGKSAEFRYLFGWDPGISRLRCLMSFEYLSLNFENHFESVDFEFGSLSYDRFSEDCASRISERDYDGNYEFRAFNSSLNHIGFGF